MQGCSKDLGSRGLGSMKGLRYQRARSSSGFEGSAGVKIKALKVLHGFYHGWYRVFRWFGGFLGQGLDEESLSFF